MDGKERYVVRGKVEEAPGVSTLALTLEDGSTPRHAPGQFIVVYFPETGTPEGKAYSVSSAPHEGALRITVRGIGQFSNRLCALIPGDTILASRPCGYFGSESPSSTLVLAAAGIGVAPMRSIALDAVATNPERRVRLFVGSRTWQDALFRDAFDALERASGGRFVATRFVSREKPAPEGAVPGRMSAEAILAALGEVPEPEFLLCGSVPFVRDLWRGLRARGVPEDAIFTEAFFSH